MRQERRCTDHRALRDHREALQIRVEELEAEISRLKGT
jgi:hypothetical protein